MTYVIINTRLVDQTVYTLVEYNFDGTLLQIEVPHFNPASTLEIAENIINRAQSELNKLQSLEHLNNLLPNIEMNDIKNLDI